MGWHSLAVVVIVAIYAQRKWIKDPAAENYLFSSIFLYLLGMIAFSLDQGRDLNIKLHFEQKIPAERVEDFDDTEAWPAAESV